MSDFRSARAEARGDEAARLGAAARARAETALVEMFLPPDLRLTEWQRATARALLERLVRTIEDELRLSLGGLVEGEGSEGLAAALGASHLSLALPALDRAEALRDADLAPVLLRRAEEHRLRRGEAIESTDPLLQELVGDADEKVAGEAMSALIGQSRRFDRFHEPVMGRTELAADLQHRLAWTVAAALRHYAVERQGFDSVRADEALAEAVRRLLSGYDEGDSLEAHAMRLAAALDGAGRLDGGIARRALEGGDLPVFLAALAVRTGLSFAAAWDVLSDRSGRGAALLVRAAGIGREDAAALLLALSDEFRMFAAGGEEAVAAQLDLYDVTGEEEAGRALRLWRLDPLYRAAIVRIRDGEGA